MNTYYFNAEFDRTLRGTPSLLAQQGDTFLHELSMHYLFACEADDTLLAHYNFPQEYFTYLKRIGLVCPQTLLYPQIKVQSHFKPFGWNKQTCALNDLHNNPTPCPSAAIIAKVNSRSFSFTLESALEISSSQNLDQPLSQGGIFYEIEILKNHLQKFEDSPKQWVIKANHGNAGAGHRYISREGMNATDEQVVQKFLHENGCVVLEPFHERVLDMGCFFELSQQGEISIPRFHRLHNSAQGVFLGVQLDPEQKFLKPWENSLHKTISSLANALYTEGYFGPVNFDIYVWKDKETLKLRPLVDINARYSMAFPAHQISKLLPDRHLLWQLPSTHALTLPTNYAQWENILDDINYHPLHQEGIFLTTPLIYTKNQQQVHPKRIGWCVVAKTEQQLNVMRNKLSLVLGKAE